METGVTIEKTILSFSRWLRQAEKSPGTVEKYLRDVRAFSLWLGERELTGEAAAQWRELLLSKGYSPGTVNSVLAGINAYCVFAGIGVRVRYLKVQRRIFRERAKELTKEEHGRLVSAAMEAGQERLALLMETVCATGIRVSEVKYITVEAAQHGRATISLKGKVRSILLPRKLCRKLMKYARKQKIASGEIFLTGSGRSLGRGHIWAQMKRLCKRAGVEPSKVFPHNLRHLFASTFYRVHRDIVRLADILGHSSIDTTRIYLMTTGEEHLKQLERLDLIL